MLTGLLQDVRIAWRLLRKSPAFTAVAVLSLSVGIGANTAIYGVIRVLLFDPMPVRAPGELALVYWHAGGEFSANQLSSSAYQDPDSGLNLASNVSFPAYQAVRDSLQGSKVGVAGYNYVRDLAVSFDDRPAVLAGGLVADGRFFSVLSPGMAMGRALGPGDDEEGAPLAAVVSYAFWMRAFGGDASAIGRTIRVNGLPAEVVGVTARGFRGLSKGGFFPQTEVTLPLRAMPPLMPRFSAPGREMFISESHLWVRLLVRVPAGESASSLESRFAGMIGSRVAPLMEQPPTRAASVRFVPGGKGLPQSRTEIRRLLFILMGVVATVLLIASVNLASLMLARGAARQRELATRRALGATRMRLVRQLLLEGLCLAILGGIGGLFLTWASRHVLTTVLTAGIGDAPLSSQRLEVIVDFRLFLWTMGLSVVAALACSLLPSLRLSRVDPMVHLKHQAAGATTTKLTVGRGLIALQIAVSVPLLVGAVLFLQTLLNLGRVELGFDPQGVAFFKLDPGATGAPEDRHAAIYQDVMTRLAAVPGVRSVTLMENVFLTGISSSGGVTVDGERVNVYRNAVGADFVETMGVRLLAGRAPGRQDGPGAPLVAAINQTAVRRLFKGQSPIGQTIAVGKRNVEIVGVVADTLYERQRAEQRPILFESALQRAGFGGHHIVLRTSVPVQRLETAIREAVAGVSRDLPVPEISTQTEQVSRAIVRERVFTQVLTIFGGFALLLVSIGLHGVTAYTVSRRQGEIGLRVALGARPAQVLWLVMRQVVVLAVVGLAIGVPLAAALAPLVGTLLFGVAPTDAGVIVASAVMMLVVAVLAGLIPARRAVRLDPLVALRTE